MVEPLSPSLGGPRYYDYRRYREINPLDVKRLDRPAAAKVNRKASSSKSVLKAGENDEEKVGTRLSQL